LKGLKLTQNKPAGTIVIFMDRMACKKLSIPVLKVNGNHTLTKDIRIATSIPWQRVHWRSIETAYNNSPFFLYYKDEFEKVFEKTV